MPIRRIASILALISLTILVAPLMLGAGKGLLASRSETERAMQAYRLIETFREHHPTAPPHVTLFDGDIEDCGYRRDHLFAPGDGLPRDHPSQRWTPYLGYWDLFIWRSRQWDREVDAHLLDILRRRTSPFTSEFLRTCMRQSVFGPVCARRVGAILATGGWSGGRGAPEGQRIDQSAQDRTICTYLDGLAARNGHPVADRSGGAMQ